MNEHAFIVTSRDRGGAALHGFEVDTPTNYFKSIPERDSNTKATTRTSLERLREAFLPRLNGERSEFAKRLQTSAKVRTFHNARNVQASHEKDNCTLLTYRTSFCCAAVAKGINILTLLLCRRRYKRISEARQTESPSVVWNLLIFFDGQIL